MRDPDLWTPLSTRGCGRHCPQEDVDATVHILLVFPDGTPVVPLEFLVVQGDFHKSLIQFS